MNSIKFILAGFVVFQAIALLQHNAFADSEGEAEVNQECGDTAIDYSNDTTLTQAERIKAMDRALNGSLNKYDSCLTEEENSASDSGSSGSGGGSGDSDGDGDGEGGGGNGSGVTSSTAASDITGNEPVQTAPVVSNINDTEGVGTSTQIQNQSNGKLPEDIPAADNDSVLEAQIRQAAINETDPKKKERLWDEYRKYKGLPSKQH
ncbi:MAG: hypothetical protein V7750_09755 [Sneathiella sp.]